MNDTKDIGTLCEGFQRVASVDPDAVAVRTVGDTETLRWREYGAQVQRIAGALAALGVTRGDTIALMMANRIEFYPIDVAALHLGATSFSIYQTLSPTGIAEVLGNAQPKLVVCEAQYVERIRAADIPFEQLIVLDVPAGTTFPGTISFEELHAMPPPADFDFDASWRAVTPEDIATLIYTSGTTGPPKGVETTHANLVFETTAVAAVLPIEYGDRITSFLPSAHIADRLTALYLQLMFGTQITVVADPNAIVAALVDCVPTLWGAVPRVWEKLKAGIEAQLANEPDPARRQAIEWAIGCGKRRVELLRDGQDLPATLAEEYAIAEETILAPLRAKLGFGELKWALSGAAPIATDTLAFFAALGLPISEIWGMSELTCIASLAPAEPATLGTVGAVVPGMQAKLADDGELLVRGPLVMRGYRGEPDKTAEVLSPDGWLHTGDVARIDEHGHITIIDRKKDLIINAAGKNISPANIENAIVACSSLIAAAVTIGEARPFLTALITLDWDIAGQRWPTISPADLPHNPEVIAELAAAIDAANAELARVEQIKRFHILPEPWVPGGEELTPTMKLRRKPIAQKYAAAIEQLYHEPRATDVHEPSARPSDTGKTGAITG